MLTHLAKTLYGDMKISPLLMIPVGRAIRFLLVEIFLFSLFKMHKHLGHYSKETSCNVNLWHIVVLVLSVGSLGEGVVLSLLMVISFIGPPGSGVPVTSGQKESDLKSIWTPELVYHLSQL